MVRNADVAADTELSDGELLAQCQRRPELFAEFYRRHRREVLGFLMKRTSCPQTAADLSSETFTVALKQRRDFDPDKGTAPAWLFGIARNLLRRFHRQESKNKLGGAKIDLTDVELDRVEELYDLTLARPTIRAALESLPANQADAVRLRVIDELSYADVATTLGVSEGNARVRVSRGLTRLAELIEPI